MHSLNLFNEILIAPARTCNRLEVVSGYATSSFLEYHLKKLKELHRPVELDLIIGMARSGIRDFDHDKYCIFTKNKAFESDVTCRYVTKGRPVHAKSYCWYKDNKPTCAFLGSSNYSMNGFFDRGQIEIMEETSANEASSFFKLVLRDTMICTESNLDLTIVNETKSFADSVKGFEQMTSVQDLRDSLEGRMSLRVSLLVERVGESAGETPNASGINWGHGEKRKHRNKDEAYLSYTADLRKTGFFPETGVTFQVITDDGESFTFVRAQVEGKALETPESNAILGFYLRNRMGIPSGEFVTQQHLENYGRTDVQFIKIDDLTYFMDFSVQSP